MNEPKILIAGIGNIFFGDDAFGVQVAQRLMQMPWPPGVKIADFGIRGLDLTYALLESWDLVILIDAVPRDQPPGTVYVLEPDITGNAQAAPPQLDAHAMDPVKVLQAAASMGAQLNRMVLVGVQPTPIDPDADLQMELSPPVAAAINEAINIVQSLVRQTNEKHSDLALTQESRS